MAASSSRGSKRHRLYLDSHLRRRGMKASGEAEFSSTMMFVVAPSLLGLLCAVMAYFRSRNAHGNMTEVDEDGVVVSVREGKGDGGSALIPV